jgi:hypothetical protein
MIELLRTTSVPRSYFVECLNLWPDRKLTLVLVPARFGKTNPLSEWNPQNPRCGTRFSFENIVGYFVQPILIQL